MASSCESSSSGRIRSYSWVKVMSPFLLGHFPALLTAARMLEYGATKHERQEKPGDQRAEKDDGHIFGIHEASA